MASRKKLPTIIDSRTGKAPVAEPATEPAPLVVHMLPAFAQHALHVLALARERAVILDADEAEVLDLIRGAINEAIVARVRGDLMILDGPGNRFPTLMRLSKDVPNPTKRDKRATRDWKQDATFKAGTLFVVEPDYSLDREGVLNVPRRMFPRGTYTHDSALERPKREGEERSEPIRQRAELFDLLLPNLERVWEHSIGALLTRYDVSAELVLATLVDRNPDLRTVVEVAFERAQYGHASKEDSEADKDQHALRNREVL